MNKLTERLQKIADNIEKGETMADIGTDHGFLPIYLLEKEISPRVIMTDISNLSLQKGEGNAGALQFGSCVDFREGDGLTVLEESEVDDIVIAGMGGLMIIRILSHDIEKSKSYKKVILQPRNNDGHLRYWLMNNGFKITVEMIAREGKYLCPIIVAEPGEDADDYRYGSDAPPDSFVWEMGQYYSDSESGVLSLELAERRLKSAIRILGEYDKKKTVSLEEYAKLKDRIEFFEIRSGNFEI